MQLLILFVLLYKYQLGFYQTQMQDHLTERHQIKHVEDILYIISACNCKSDNLQLCVNI